MIDFTIADIIGGEPMSEMPETVPVFYVRTPREKTKVLEKVVAANAHEALAEAKRLLGDVEGLYVTGPYEHVAKPHDGDAEKA